MRVAAADAPASAGYAGKAYYHSTQTCHDRFVAGPAFFTEVPQAPGRPPRLTEQDLAARSGTTVEHIRKLVDLGMLEPAEDDFTQPPFCALGSTPGTLQWAYEADVLAAPWQPAI